VSGAFNRHTVEVSGQTLRELCTEAADMFDAYFGRDNEILWEVVDFTARRIVTMQRGDGAEIGVRWEAEFVAEVNGVKIGSPSHEPAMWFPTP
jgi:hypothetical protein